MKPARPAGQGATVTPVGKPPTMPPRAPDLARPGEGRPAETPRRISEPLGGGQPTQRRAEGTEDRKLIVGREITLSGQITSCDKLIVEGSVEADLTNCRDVDILESGLFKGSASIEAAEIRGRFEGNLVCRKRLFIKASGRVSGTIRYGQLEVEAGGQISGDIQAQPGADSDLIEVHSARAAG
ncbi:MAG: polymer-forming cytoskeletal protein [Alphaproteobacteria bacterium]|nr:polymer-forming cytoskeletal protein [Alphaproteobacteria bacterium]